MKKEEQKRRPKGLGSVSYLGKGRSKPYMALIEQRNDIITGKRKKYVLGTFKTREQASRALDIHFMKENNIIPKEIRNKPKYENQYLDFYHEMCNKGIVDEDFLTADNIDIVNQIFLTKLAKEGIDLRKIKPISNAPSFADVWDTVKETDLRNLKNQKTLYNYDISFKHLKDIHGFPIDTISLKDIQPIFDQQMRNQASYAKMNRMRIVLSHCFKHAIKYDLATTNYAEYVNFYESRNEIKKREAFDDVTIKKLWNSSKDPNVQTILIMIYTGMRPGEFVSIKKVNVHLKERYIIGGIKTKAGINRIIPIHEKIVPFIQSLLKNDSKDYLYEGNGNYQNYLRNSFDPVKQLLGFNFTPHCCRHTFATIAKMAGMNEYARKKIMGHSCNDLTDDTYTHAPIKFLIDEVNKIRIE